MSAFSELMDQNRVSRRRQRKIANTVMLSFTGLVTALALVPLFWIIGYVIIRGGKNINLDFFIHLPRPLGMAGGGVLSAIEGTLVVTLLAALFAIPPGVLAAFYAALEPRAPNVRKPLTTEEWAQRCDRCHGINGNSTDPRLPGLASQRRDYVEKVLHAYRSGERRNTTMAAMAADLSEAEVDNLAAHYARQKARPVVFASPPGK